jgi:hypothetical protein
MGFDKPEQLWQKQLNELFTKKEPSETEKILNVVGLIVHSSKNEDMSRLYSQVGLKAFTEVIEVFGGRTVKFIEKEQLRENLVLALCYYYREVKGYSWDKIKNTLPFEINPVSMGIRISSLNSKIRKEIDEILEIVEVPDGEQEDTTE